MRERVLFVQTFNFKGVLFEREHYFDGVLFQGSTENHEKLYGQLSRISRNLFLVVNQFFLENRIAEDNRTMKDECDCVALFELTYCAKIMWQ